MTNLNQPIIPTPKARVLHLQTPPRRVLLIVILLGLGTLALYARTSNFEFINYDDRQYVTQNPRLRLGLSWQGVRWALTSLYFYNWHPITWLTYLFTAQAFGMSAAAFHTVNYFVHAINAALLCYVLWRLTGEPALSAIASALYASHPLRVESVAWVSETKDVLSGLFLLLTILAYTRYRERPTLARYLVVTVAILTALASKPSTVTLPALLLLLDYWPLGAKVSTVGKRTRGIALVLEKVPWLLLAIGAAARTMIAQRSSGGVASVAAVPFGDRASNALVSIAQYLLKTFWPTRLSIFYPHPFVVGPPTSTTVIVLAAIVVLLISAAAFHYRRAKPFLFVGWFWFLLMLSPMLGLVQAGEQAMADRYTYLPSMGLIVGFVWLVSSLIDSRDAWVARISGAATVIALAGLVAATWMQIGHWRNSQTLFAHADRVTSRNYLARSYLALAESETDHHDAAISAARSAVAVAANHPLPHYALAKSLERAGRLLEAVPEYQACADLTPNVAVIRIELGLLLARTGHPREALQQFSRAIQLEPSNSVAYNGTAAALAEMGDFDKAIALWRQTVRLDPGFASAHGWLATALQRQGDRAGAVHHYRAAYSGGERRTQWMADLAWLLATDARTRGEDAEFAVKIATDANAREPDQPLLLDTLAAAHARAGRFNDAVATSERAAALASSAGRADLAKTIQSRMMIYRTGRAYEAVR